MRVVRVPISATASSASKSLGTCGIHAVSMPAFSAHSISASIRETLRAESPRSAPIITPRRTFPSLVDGDCQPECSYLSDDNVLAKKENANIAALTRENAEVSASRGRESRHAGWPASRPGPQPNLATPETRDWWGGMWAD